MPRFGCGKKFSHGRNSFPSLRWAMGVRAQQSMGKLYADQLVAVRMRDPDNTGLQTAGSLGQTRGRSHWGTGNFQQNPCRKRQRAAHGYQGSPSRHVQRRGKFQQFLVIAILTPNKNGHCEGKTLPSSVFGLRLFRAQVMASATDESSSWPHIRGQTRCRMGAISQPSSVKAASAGPNHPRNTPLAHKELLPYVRNPAGRTASR